MRHAALHARAEAFPLGLAVLIGKGVTAWRNALADLIGPPCPPTRGSIARAGSQAASGPASLTVALPAEVAGELVNVLAAMTLVPT